jgi:hypothetical protein
MKKIARQMRMEATPKEILRRLHGYDPHRHQETQRRFYKSACDIYLLCWFTHWLEHLPVVHFEGVGSMRLSDYVLGA